MLRRRSVKAVAAVVIVTAVGPNPGFAFQVPAPPRDTPAPTRAEGRVTPRPAQARRAAGQGMLDLEDAIARAELVLAVRLVDMTEAKIVHGGKTEVITQQFRFEPVRTLKGIFARDSLLLTGQDLGIYQFGEAADRLGRGQMLLLLLGRQGPGYFNCNTAGSLDQSIPRLRDQADPLLAAVESLIGVTQQRDRAVKVTTLLAALRKAKDRDAVPLLISLGRRALVAAQTPGAAEVVAPFAGSPSPEVREAAAKAIAALLDADYLRQRELRERSVVAGRARLAPTSAPGSRARALALRGDSPASLVDGQPVSDPGARRRAARPVERGGFEVDRLPAQSRASSTASDASESVLSFARS